MSNLIPLSKWMTLQPLTNSECTYAGDQSGDGVILYAGERQEFDIDTDRFVGVDPSSFFVTGKGYLMVAVLVEE